MIARSLAARRLGALTLALASALVAGACDPLTDAEATRAVRAALLAAEAEALPLATVELMTGFPRGDDPAVAAEALAAAVEAALPCAAVTREAATLTVHYGALADTCAFGGRTIAGGLQTVTLVASGAEEAIVSHAWEGLRTDRVAVDGEATARFVSDAGPRHVTHDLDWTRLSDGATASGTGEVVVTPLPPAEGEGFLVDGARDFEDAAGAWSLRADGARMRWADPCPEAGRFAVGAPFAETIELRFDRVSTSAIAVVAAEGGRSYHFEVSSEPGGT